MRLREFTDGTWARKAQIKVPTHTKTFFSFCRRMKWSIPQSTDLGHSIPSPFMATLRILQLVPCKKRLRCFVLMWCPTICCNTTKKHQGLPSWSHGRVAHHGNQGLPQPRVHVHDGVLLTNLPVERQKLPEKVLHKKQCLEVEKKRRQATTNMLWSFGMEKEGLSKRMKPRISFSKKEADIRFWNLPWSFHHGNPPVIQVTRAWRLPIDIFGDLVFLSSWVPAWSFLAVAAEVLSKMTRKLILAKISENFLPGIYFESICCLQILHDSMAFLIWACSKTRATSRMVSLPTRTATIKYMLCIPHVWAMGHTCLAIWCLQSWQVIGPKNLSDTQTTIAAFPSRVGW